jgi:hypothetical protein
MLGTEEIIIGKENITKDVWGSLADIFRTELAGAEIEQKKLMEAEKRVSGGERKDLPFGRLRFKVCQEVYHFWGGKLGYECWKDKSFLSWLEKRFGDLVSIKSKSAKLGI